MLQHLFGGASADVAEVDVHEAKRRLDAGSLLLDVREHYEWREGHARGARHLPLGELSQRLSEIPTDREVLVICRSGNRSRSAAGLLQRAGYKQVVNVRGGTTAWMRQSLPVA